MGGAAATRRAAGADKRLVHDAANGARTTPALGATAETALDLAGRARRGLGDGAAHLAVAQHIAGTDDHGIPGMASIACLFR